MKFKTITLMLLLSIFTANAQSGYKITIDLPSNANEWAYIAQYWDGKPYSIDSTLLSNKGKGVLESKVNLVDGQYLLYAKPNTQLQLLLNGEKKNITISENTKTNKYSITGSNDTKLLWHYIEKTNKNREQASDIENQLNDSTITLSTEHKKELIDKLNIINNQFQQETDHTIAKNEGSWLSLYLKGMQPIRPPYTPSKSNEEAMANREYLKSHYFDNIDMKDPRFWQTTYFPDMIDIYLNSITEPIQDSVAYAASWLVEKTEGNEICFKNMLSRLTNDASQSRVMGSENIWAKLAEDYIFDKNISWIDSTQLKQLKLEYEKSKYSRIGMAGHDLTLETLNGDSLNIYDINSDYTVLYFYDPTCGHCRKEIPLLHNDFYAKYRDKGVTILAINVNPSEETWKKFVTEDKLSDWVNCSDHNFKSKYWMYYDVSATPSVFVLDKNKKIIAKKLDEKMLSRFFSYIIK